MRVTLFAKFELIFVGVFTMVAAVAIVPVARLDVVVIVADAIALEFRDRASGCLPSRVQTCAFETVLVLLHIASFATTVTAVPTAATVVVIIVAVFVTRVCSRAARPFAFFCSSVGCGILAGALVTVPELATVSVVVAAVPIVPVACLVVIRIITESIFFVCSDTSRARVQGVQTQAIVAVLGRHVTTAVTTIPCARGFVVAVVTVCVSLVLWHSTISSGGLAFRVTALAVFAVHELISVFLPIAVELTAITAIPVASLHVVVVIAVIVALVLGTTALVHSLCAVATGTRAPEDILEDFALHSMFPFPLGTSSFKAKVRFTCLLSVVGFALATTTIATVGVFQT